MKRIECEGVGDNDGFFESPAVGLSTAERVVSCHHNECLNCVPVIDGAVCGRGYAQPVMGVGVPALIKCSDGN